MTVPCFTNVQPSTETRTITDVALQQELERVEEQMTEDSNFEFLPQWIILPRKTSLE